MPDDARCAGLTLIGWLARRMPGEAASTDGVEHARKQLEDCARAARRARAAGGSLDGRVSRSVRRTSLAIVSDPSIGASAFGSEMGPEDAASEPEPPPISQRLPRP